MLSCCAYSARFAVQKLNRAEYVVLEIAEVSESTHKSVALSCHSCVVAEIGGLFTNIRHGVT